MICKLDLTHLFISTWVICFIFHNFNGFCRHSFNESRKYFEVLQMAQPQIILWWYFIGRSWGGAKERSILSLLITSFVSACLAPSKPPSYGEVMSSLCNCCMEHFSKRFGTNCSTPYSEYVISKLSWAIGDSHTF